MNKRIKLTGEDFANIVTHSLGLVFFLAATPFLIYQFLQTASLLAVFGISIFCCSLVMVYLSSTIYHSVTTQPFFGFL
jgi:hemolysin III